MKIYTKTGDGGSTSLVGGKRIEKSSDLLDAYGTIDELNAAAGMALEELRAAEAAPGQERAKAEAEESMLRIINQLFTVGGMLATEPADWEKYWGAVPLAAWTEAWERQIDEWAAGFPKQDGFILPCGSRSIAVVQWVRTVCRRAERAICKTEVNGAAENGAYTEVKKYVNRLSDFFFILARKMHQIENIRETYWKSVK